MTTPTVTTDLSGRELRLMRAFFLVAALWNFAGAFPGIFDSAGMFEREFGYILADPVMVSIYRGAWATAFLYGIGFLMVAYKPERHTGVVLMGGLGKALFALNLLIMYLNDWTSDFAIVVIGGDAVFVIIFIVYFIRLRRHGHTVI